MGTHRRVGLTGGAGSPGGRPSPGRCGDRCSARSSGRSKREAGQAGGPGRQPRAFTRGRRASRLARGGTSGDPESTPTGRSSPRGPGGCRGYLTTGSGVTPKWIRGIPVRAAGNGDFVRIARAGGFGQLCSGTMKFVPTRILLAWPRGYCAGVERAVDTVERALRIYGPPVYVRKQIVHNIHVVRDLEGKGAVFVEEETEAPEGAVLSLSAHGVAPGVYANSMARGLSVIDATCPLVTKVHLEARRFARDDYTILLIGHEGHEEVVGTSGEAPDDVILVGSPEQARSIEVSDPDRVAGGAVMALGGLMAAWPAKRRVVVLPPPIREQALAEVR